MVTEYKPAWAAVVVNFDAGRCLVDCVATLLLDTSAGVFEIIVVDNASTDDSISQLRQTWPDVKVILSERNLGYSGAANLGIRATRADVVVVCNPDLEIKTGTAAAMLKRFSAEPDLGALGPAVFSTSGDHYPSARQVPQLRDVVGHGTLGLVMPKNRFTRRYQELDFDPNKARDVDWVSGAMIWLRRSALDQVGGFDDGYFMYVEDVDLCWRLGRAGWRVAYEPSGSVIHLGAVSTQRHPYRMIVAHHRSLWRFAVKRWTGVKKILLIPAAIYLSFRALTLIGFKALSLRRMSRPLKK